MRGSVAAWLCTNPVTTSAVFFFCLCGGARLDLSCNFVPVNFVLVFYATFLDSPEQGLRFTLRPNTGRRFSLLLCLLLSLHGVSQTL